MTIDSERIVIRPLRADELQAAIRLERACYSAEAAATPEAFAFRLRYFPDYFLSAWDGERLHGLACGIRTDESDCGSDGIKGDHPPERDGRNLCVLSVAVDPENRRNGIGERLMQALVTQARADRLDGVILMCERHLIRFYERMGFNCSGVSPSRHGGIEWHEMKLAFSCAR